MPKDGFVDVVTSIYMECSNSSFSVFLKGVHIYLLAPTCT